MNRNLLRAAIVEQGLTQGELAKLMGISSNSLSRKLRGKRQFTLNEVDSITRILQLQNPSAIFLGQHPNYATKEESNT